MIDFDMREVVLLAVLQTQLNTLKTMYFQDLSDLEVEVADLAAPGQLDAETAQIFIDRRIASFQEKTTQIVFLHELIHYKLFKENGDADDAEGERFEAEVRRLWDAGAYIKLL